LAVVAGMKKRLTTHNGQGRTQFKNNNNTSILVEYFEVVTLKAKSKSCT